MGQKLLLQNRIFYYMIRNHTARQDFLLYVRNSYRGIEFSTIRQEFLPWDRIFYHEPGNEKMKRNKKMRTFHSLQLTMRTALKGKKVTVKEGETLTRISHKKSTAMPNLPMPAALHSLRLLDVQTVRLRRLRSCVLHPWASLTSRYDLL